MQLRSGRPTKARRRRNSRATAGRVMGGRAPAPAPACPRGRAPGAPPAAGPCRGNPRMTSVNPLTAKRPSTPPTGTRCARSATACSTTCSTHLRTVARAAGVAADARARGARHSARGAGRGRARRAGLREFLETVVPYDDGQHPSALLGLGHGQRHAAGRARPTCWPRASTRTWAAATTPATRVEQQVLDWFKEMLGFPADASGLLVSGGSMANLVALTVARNARGGRRRARARRPGAAPGR